VYISLKDLGLVAKGKFAAKRQSVESKAEEGRKESIMELAITKDQSSLSMTEQPSPLLNVPLPDNPRSSMTRNDEIEHQILNKQRKDTQDTQDTEGEEKVPKSDNRKEGEVALTLEPGESLQQTIAVQDETVRNPPDLIQASSTSGLIPHDDEGWVQ